MRHETRTNNARNVVRYLCEYNGRLSVSVTQMQSSVIPRTFCDAGTANARNFHQCGNGVFRGVHAGCLTRALGLDHAQERRYSLWKRNGKTCGASESQAARVQLGCSAFSARYTAKKKE